MGWVPDSVCRIHRDRVGDGRIRAHPLGLGARSWASNRADPRWAQIAMPQSVQARPRTLPNSPAFAVTSVAPRWTA
jgi:hypothetical protein